MKNLLVLAAPGAAGVLDERDAIVAVIGAFVALGLVASGTYAINDAFDADADRLHPTKRHRPVASRAISVRQAMVIGATLIAAGIGLAAIITWQLGVVVVTYALVTTSYSLVLKRYAYVDIATVAAGFVLRAVAGAAAVEVHVSGWFLIVALFGSTLMVAGKRLGELSLIDAEGHRLVLARYSPSFLGLVQRGAAAGAIASYTMFALDRARDAGLDVPWFELTVLPFVFGVLWYLRRLDRDGGGDPTDLVLRDPVLLALGLAWAAMFGAGVYAG